MAGEAFDIDPLHFPQNARGRVGESTEAALLRLARAPEKLNLAGGWRGNIGRHRHKSPVDQDHVTFSVDREVERRQCIDPGRVVLAAIEDDDFVSRPEGSLRHDRSPFTILGARHQEIRKRNRLQGGSAADFGVEVPALVEAIELPHRKIRHDHHENDRKKMQRDHPWTEKKGDAAHRYRTRR